ncbi:MAG: hypothetical protein Q7U51_06880 [Methanoregula sp.]|nr:hypothetical protein [Methanoregula sp.]
MCNSDIRDIRTMPDSSVSAHGHWVIAPHGTWQFFRITADAVTDIRSDGSAMPCTLASSPDLHLVLLTGSVIPGLGMGGITSMPGDVVYHYSSSLQYKT